MENLLKIRPHHLFCLLGFKGIGYSTDFVSNMAGISEKIKKNSEIEIKLVSGCDDICRSCPYFSNFGCAKNPDSEVRLNNKEMQIISLLQIETDRTEKAGILYEKIRERFSLGMFDWLCNDCEWYSMGYCRNEIESLKEGGFHEKI